MVGSYTNFGNTGFNISHQMPCIFQRSNGVLSSGHPLNINAEVLISNILDCMFCLLLNLTYRSVCCLLRMFYAPGGPYATINDGKAASRALTKMPFEPKDLTGDIPGLGCL